MSFVVSLSVFDIFNKKDYAFNLLFINKRVMNKLLLVFGLVAACLSITALVLVITKNMKHVPSSISNPDDKKELFKIAKPGLFIISCEKNKSLHQKYKDKPNTFVVIGDPDMKKKYKIIKRKGIQYLYVQCDDKYFALPAKVMMAIEAFTRMPELNKYTNFYKIDDDCDIDYDAVKKGYPYGFLTFISKNPWAGVLIFKNHGKRFNSIYHQKYAYQDPQNYWATHSYQGNGVNYLRGSNYIIQRSLANKINSVWHSDNMTELLTIEVCEDVAMGQVCSSFDAVPTLLPKNSRFVIDEFDNESAFAVHNR